MASETSKEYHIINRIYANPDQKTILKYSQELQAQQDNSMTRRMRDNYNRVYKVWFAKDKEWLLASRSCSINQISLRIL